MEGSKPHWWAKYDYFHPTDIDVEEATQIYGLPFVARGFTRPGREPLFARWDYTSDEVYGYILDGNWKDSLPYKRFGWCVGFTEEGLKVADRYRGFVYAAGECPSVERSAAEIWNAASRARAFLQRERLSTGKG